MTVTPVFGAPEGWDAFLLARRRAEAAGAVLHVTRDDARMARLAEALAFVMPEAEILRFPAWDCLPYDRVSPNPVLVAERVATLTRLLEKSTKSRVVLTTVNALVQRIPPREAFEGASMALATGGTVQPEKLAAFLESHGYGRAGTVMEPGEYAMRGGIIDLFPAGEPDPVRLDLFGDFIESIRIFDPSTQRSGTKRGKLTLRPVSEVPLDKDAVARFRSAWRELFEDAADDPIYQSISAGRRHPGMEHWVPLFHPRMETLLDYLPGASVSLDHQADDVLTARLEMIDDHYNARRAIPRDGEVPYRPLPPDRLYLSRTELGGDAGRRSAVRLLPVRQAGWRGRRRWRRPPRPDLRASRRRTRYQRLRSASLAGRTLGHRRAPPRDRRLDPRFARAPGASAARARRSRRGAGRRLGSGPPQAGRRLSRLSPWASSAASSPTGWRWWASRTCWAPASPAPRAPASAPISSLPKRPKSPRATWSCTRNTASAATTGLATLHVTGAPHDCLKLIYDGDEKLFLPVENIEVLSRYGSDQQGVALDKLGGTAWQSRKARMKSRIRDMAGELIRIAATRQIRDAEIMAPPGRQLRRVLRPLPVRRNRRPVARHRRCAGGPCLRPADGPADLRRCRLRQDRGRAARRLHRRDVRRPGRRRGADHAARAPAFPHVLGTLRRAADPGRATVAHGSGARKQPRSSAASPTAASTSLSAPTPCCPSPIAFASLGLLVVDEEQHFGVAHKERLKALRADVHVLTLTATPIPRTLQLALSGVREMSLIATPPVDRLAVRTFIMPFDQRGDPRGDPARTLPRRPDLLRRAADRGHAAASPSASTQIVPEAKIATAHGRLAPTALERVMTEFSDGRYDILLSTNIVESGLDMPAVNTLVIHRADMFGLGQLYQFRGRVGRGKQRGYAYLTWPPNHRLSVAAEKRLTVMQTLDALGAGFTLASHDLDIRGAGNLLGDEQSGHIREVGIELYQQMLEDAVGEIRAGDRRAAGQEREWTPNISLGLPVLIPESTLPTCRSASASTAASARWHRTAKPKPWPPNSPTASASFPRRSKTCSRSSP